VNAKTVGFVTFECELAPLGGLAAVMRVLPQAFTRLPGWSSFILAPFFRTITRCHPKMYDAIQTTGQEFPVVYGDHSHEAEVFQYMGHPECPIFLIDSPGFFNPPCDCGDPPNPQRPCNPYLYPDQPQQLLEDSLFFCAAVPKALQALGLTNDIVLSLQDWETAAVGLTIQKYPILSSVACVLTLHNSYDHDITKTEMQRIFSKPIKGSSILNKVIPLLDSPVCTVSEQFASELENEPLHSKVYAPHLQDGFKQKTIVGINNGLFGQRDFPEHLLSKTGDQQLELLLQEKQRRQSEMIQVLKEYQPDQAWGELTWDDFHGPIFLFLGRDDSRQKGFDLAAAAIQHIPLGQAKYIFTPIPGDEGLEGLHFLRDLAESRSGEVKVFPFRMAQGFMEIQKGASYMVMCSFYEPFGAASEGYAVGTPIVARATGGLIQQVVPYPSPCCTPLVQKLAGTFHGETASPTGFLFREPELSSKVVESGWKSILACKYWPNKNRLEERKNNALFESMVESASLALRDAIEVHSTAPLKYAQMIRAGFDLLDQFSWDTAVEKYAAVFREAKPPHSSK